MSIKVYQEKPESEELFLRLMHIAPGESPSVQMVDKDGHPFEVGSVAVFTPDGVRLVKRIDRELAARAGLTNALDANGRLKVIGQEVEAEEMQSHSYKCDHSDNDALRVELASSHGRIAIGLVVDGLCTTNVLLNAKQIRTLADTLNSHLAYLEQEGLA